MPPKDSPHEPTRTPKCPPLPPEIWINIFRFHTSLTHLWTTCRRVSTTLRACVEHAFSAFFLREIHINFYLDKHNLGGRSGRREVSVTFDRVGTGASKELVWFSDKSPVTETKPNSAQVTHEKRMQRWEENVQKSKPELPNYTIRIGNMVNDTALPGLRVDVKNREITFEWRKALYLFFREEARVLALWARLQADKPRVAAVEDESARRAVPEMTPFTAWAGMRISVRRARLREAYSHNEKMLWAIESLQYFPFGSARATNLLPDLPGAGMGEKWFGNVNFVQELYLDEVNCIDRIETRLASETVGLER